MNDSNNMSPLPGDFLTTPGNTSRGEAGLPSKEQKIKKEEDPKKESNVEEDTVFKLPTSEEEQDSYLKGLKIANLTKAQAVAIMDSVIRGNVYTETIKVCNRIDVVLGTRSYRDLQRASQLIDNADVNLPMHINDLIARYNLAASLRSYGSRVFNFPPNAEEAAEAFQIRLDFIYTLPEVVVNQLIQHLHTFDFKVNAVFAKGAPEDF